MSYATKAFGKELKHDPVEVPQRNSRTRQDHEVKRVTKRPKFG